MSAKRPAWLGLALALLAYFALRALVLVTNFDEVAIPQYELFPMGTIPLLASFDGGLPISRLYDNAAGQLLTGWLAIPSYALFGPTYLALKLVPLTLGAVALVCVWLLLRGVTCPRGAFAGALLFALGPTTLVKYSLMASGNHFETLTFTALALFATLRMHRLGVTPARLFASAATWGFSIFVFLGALTPIALLAALHLGLRGWRATLRDTGWLATGFAVGVSPLLALNWLTGGRGLQFLEGKFGGGGAGLDLARAAQRLGQFLFEHLPAATQFRSFAGLPGELARWAFLAAFVVSYVLLLSPAFRGAAELARGALGRGATPSTPGALRETLGRALCACLCAYLPLTALAYATSSLEIVPKEPPLDAEGYRYFNTHLFFATLQIAIAGARLARRATALLPALAAPALFAGLFNSALIDWSFSHLHLGAHYDGFNLKQTANQLLSPRNGYTREQACELASAYPRPMQAALYLGMGRVRAMQQFQRSRAGALVLWSALDEFPPEARAEVARGFGVFFRHASRVLSRLDRRFLELAKERLAAGDPLAPAALEGLATDWEIALACDLPGRLAELEALSRELESEPALRPHFIRGVGALLGRTLRRGIESEAALIAPKLPGFASAARTEFYEGLGAGLEEGLREPQLASGLEQSLPPDADLAALARGRAQRRSELGLEAVR